MKSFRCLNIMVTNKCPLLCRHCAPESGPQEFGIIDKDLVLSALIDAKVMNCQIVNFSGGEPFVIGDALTELVAMATRRGLVTRITTGAYWSTSEISTQKRLAPLVKAGLQQLFVSCSRTHLEFISFDNVCHAINSAQGMGIEVRLYVSSSGKSNGQISNILKQLERREVMIPPIMESLVIPFGRATVYFSNDLSLSKVASLSGPCPSLSEHPTIHTNGLVVGCGAVFGGECDALTFGNITESSLSEIVDRMNKNMLVAWIHKIGVVELKQFIEANSNIHFDERYVNICHVCGDILSNPEAVNFLKEAGFLQPFHGAVENVAQDHGHLSQEQVTK